MGDNEGTWLLGNAFDNRYNLQYNPALGVGIFSVRKNKKEATFSNVRFIANRIRNLNTKS